MTNKAITYKMDENEQQSPREFYYLVAKIKRNEMQLLLDGEPEAKQESQEKIEPFAIDQKVEITA